MSFSVIIAGPAASSRSSAIRCATFGFCKSRLAFSLAVLGLALLSGWLFFQAATAVFSVKTACAKSSCCLLSFVATLFYRGGQLGGTKKDCPGAVNALDSLRRYYSIDNYSSFFKGAPFKTTRKRGFLLGRKGFSGGEHRICTRQSGLVRRSPAIRPWDSI